MISNKHFNRVVMALLCLTLLVTTIFCLSPQTLGISEAERYSSYQDLFAQGTVMEVSITADADEWQEMLENASQEEYIPCDVSVNGNLVANAAIRPKGNTSLSQVVSSDSDRYSFKIEFDHYQSGQTLLGLDKLILNNTFSDATYIKEFIGYEIFDTIGVVTPLHSFAHITVNGEEWGLYLALEAVEDSFAYRAYGYNAGQFYKPETTGGGAPGGQEGESGGGPRMGGGPGGGPGGAPGMGGQGGPMGPSPEGFSMQNRTEEGTLESTPQESSTVQTAAHEYTAENADSQLSSKPTESSSSDSAESQEAGFQAPQDGNISGQPAMDGGGPGMGGGSGMGGGPGGGGPGGGMSGGSLSYIDDDPESYSTIFDSAVFDLDEEDEEDMIRSLKVLSGTDYTEIEKYIDVDACLRYFAGQSFIINFDSYFGSMQHNYYLREANQQLTMLPWDINLAFGGFNSSSATEAVNWPIDTPLGDGIAMEDRPLVGTLLSNPEYLERYHQYLQQICDDYVNSGIFTTQLELYSDLLAPYVENDATAFYTLEEFKTGIKTLKTFVLLRAESVLKQLNGEISSTSDERTDEEALVDASAIELKDMGTQGGDGAGGKGDIGGQMGDFHERRGGPGGGPGGPGGGPGNMQPPEFSGDQPSDNMQPQEFSENPPSGNMQPPEFSSENPEVGQAPNGMNASPDRQFSAQTGNEINAGMWAALAAILILGFTAALLTHRKKYKHTF